MKISTKKISEICDPELRTLVRECEKLRHISTGGLTTKTFFLEFFHTEGATLRKLITPSEARMTRSLVRKLGSFAGSEVHKFFEEIVPSPAQEHEGRMLYVLLNQYVKDARPRKASKHNKIVNAIALLGNLRELHVK